MSQPQPEQFYFVSNRNFTLRSTAGRSITFAKGKPTHVPKMLHQEAIERGLLACDDKGVPFPEKGEEIVEASEKAEVKLAPTTREERDEAMAAVFEAMVKRNNAAEFTGGGTPNAEAVSMALGFKVDQKEVRTLWLKVRAKLVGGSNE